MRTTRTNYETNLAAKQELEELMEINRLQLDLLRRLRADAPSLSSLPSGTPETP